MRLYLKILITLIALLVDACALRRKNPQEASLDASENRESGGYPEPNEERPKIDLASLAIPTVRITSQKVCSKDAKMDEILSIEVTSEEPYDQFNARLCKKSNSEDCTTPQAFLVKGFILSASSAGDFSVHVQGCLDPNHSQNPEALCGGWTKGQDFTFKDNSEESKKRLQKKDELRQKMTGICQEIKTEMKHYLDHEKDPASKLRPLVDKNYTNIGIYTCSEMLLSSELSLLEDLSRILPSNENQGPQAPTIIVQTPSDPYAGYIFLAAGSLGTLYGGYQTVNTLIRTVSEEGVNIAKEIVELQKKEKFVESRRYEVEIDNLKKIVSNIESLGKNRAVENMGDLLNTDRIDKEFEDVLKKASEDWPTANFKEVVREFTEGASDPEKIWGEFEKVQPKDLSTWDWMFGNKNMGYKPETWAKLASSFVVNDTPFQTLYRLAQQKELIKWTENNIAKCQGMSPQACKDRFTDKIKKLENKRAQVQVTWEKYLRELGTATASGVGKGAFAGGTVGATLGHLMSPLGGGLHGMGYGAAAGSLAGGVRSFLEAQKNLASPTWSDEENAVLKKGILAKDIPEEEIKDVENKKGTKAIQTIEDLQKSIKDARLEQESKLKVERMSPDSLKAKGYAVLPWLIGTGLSVGALAVGANEFALASSYEQDFLKNYSRLYKEGQVVQKAYQSVMSELMNPGCL